MRKRAIGFAMSMMLGAMMLTGCGAEGDNSASTGFDTSSKISVVSREDGSGTRGAFVELCGIEQDDVDNTTTDAIITNSTSVMLTTVSGNPAAIGYVSLGSLNDTVKAVDIEGVEATASNVATGEYSISRPFNIAVREDLCDAASDFIQFIMSVEGQQIVEDAGYIKVAGTQAYQSTGATGTVNVSGSSSVTPVMEKIKEAYEAVNSNVTVQIQESDSSTGMSDVINGTSDIGMASRELKESELEKGIVGTEIARDGIAVIVNNENTTENLNVTQVADIFTGTTTTWSEIEE